MNIRMAVCGLAIGLFCHSAPALAHTGAPVVSVNPYVMQSLGAEPNVPSQFYDANEARKPFAVTNAKRARSMGYNNLTGRFEPPPPPRQKPKSNVSASLHARENWRKNGTFKAAPKSSFQSSGGSFLPITGTFINNIMGGNSYPGYRWSDIDPRTRGANLTVTRPSGGTVVGSVAFEKGESEIGTRGKSQLKQTGAQLKQTGSPAELHGYADAGKNGKPADARRLALSRVLEVRDALINMGVPGGRLGVKPIGAAESGAKDRVDIVVKR